jgi:hypothetical protein
MTYVKVSVAKPGQNKGAGGDKKDRIILFDMDDIVGQNYPARDASGVVMAGNLAFKANAYMINVYATSSSVKVGSNTEGEQDAEGFIHTLEFEHPGNELAIREFKANWISKNFGAIVEHCSSNKKDLLGTPCAALRCTIKWEDDKDKNKTTLSFKSSQKDPHDIADYQGTTTFDTVTGLVSVDSLNINLATGEGRYQLTDGSVAAVKVATCSNPVNGMVFTLLGSGGTNPSTIEDGDEFILASGATWTALANSAITFKAFKNGANSYQYIEQSRV